MEVARNGVRFVTSFLRATLLSASMTISEFVRRRKNYVVGVLTVIVVVLVTAVILAGVAKSPIMFMKLAEQQTGELDMVMVRSNARGALPFMNATDARTRAENKTGVKAELEDIVPRWFVTAEARRKWAVKDERTGLREEAADGKRVGATVMMLDSAREHKIKLGRKWPHRRIGESECHVKDTILRQLGIEANTGTHIVLEIDVRGFLDNDVGTGLGPSLTLGQTPTLNATGGLNGPLFGLFGLNENDEVGINTTALADNLERLFGLNVTRPANASDVPTTRVGDLQTPGFLLNGTNGTALTLFDLLPGGKLSMDLDVVGSIGDAEGKYPSAVGNAILVDSEYFLHTVVEQLCYSTQKRMLEQFGVTLPDVAALADALNIEEYALMLVSMFTERRELYTKPQPDLETGVTVKSDAIVRALDVRYNATMTFPLPLAMNGFYFLRLFLDQIFNAVIITIGVLGCILIYSLLLSNVEEKTFEHGILRALGLRKVGLINLITVQALAFAIPGTALAMALAVAMNAVLEDVISDFSGFSADYGNIGVNALVFPILIGLLVPLISNVVPIRRAMGQSLRGALDVSHQEHTETEITVQKLEGLGLELWQTLLAIFMVLSGFMVYYMMPFSFIFNDLPLFFFMLLIVLMCMLFGLCMVSYSLQSWLEIAVLRCILWGKDRILRVLITKNLSGHRTRSAKTYMMFTISTASIIFGGVVFTLQAKSITSNIDVLVGSDIQVQSLEFDHPLERPAIDAFLNKSRHAEGGSGVVSDWCFASFGINKYDQFARSRASNLLFFPAASSEPTAIDRNYQNVAPTKYFLVTETESSTKESEVIQSLYTKRSALNTYQPEAMYSGFPPGEAEPPNIGDKYLAEVDVVVSAGAKDFMSLATNSRMKIEVSKSESRGPVQQEKGSYVGRPRALVSKMPGYPFIISSYSFSVRRAPLFMSTDSFQRILDENTPPGYEEHLTDIYYEKLFIKLKDGTSKFERESVINELKGLLSREYHVVLDAQELKDTTAVAVDLLLTFFYSISAIAVTLNLFLLWMSFSTNVTQNAWSFAVMRSLGFTVTMLIKAYIYEALCTVLSAFLCGSVIGLIIAITLTAQFNMFLEMPLDFEFPWILFLVVAFEALFSAIVGSWWPARELRRREIAHVLKSQ